MVELIPTRELLAALPQRLRARLALLARTARGPGRAGRSEGRGGAGDGTARGSG